MLLDVGEGTMGQIWRMYGTATTSSTAAVLTKASHVNNRLQIDHHGVGVSLTLVAGAAHLGARCAGEVYMKFRGNVAAAVAAISNPMIGTKEVSTAHCTIRLLQPVLHCASADARVIASSQVEGMP